MSAVAYSSRVCDGYLILFGILQQRNDLYKQLEKRNEKIILRMSFLLFFPFWVLPVKELLLLWSYAGLSSIFCVCFCVSELHNLDIEKIKFGKQLWFLLNGGF